jgi:cytochrome P450
MSSDKAATLPDAVVPAHVPPALVYDIRRYGAPNTLDDPFSVTANVFDELPPVAYTPHGTPGLYSGAWVVSRYEDIREVYQNDKLYSTKGAADFVSLVGETFRMIPLALDPPEHASYRLLLNSWFSPKSINAMEPAIRATITGLIDTFVDKGACDVAYDYARIYPVRVFLDLMGFPQDMMDDFLQWEYAILHSYGDVPKMQWGIGSAIKYLRGFMAQVKANPDSKLASHIVHGQVDGRPMNDDEIIGTLTFLWLGGLDTVAATTALALRHLALDHQLQQKLRDQPQLISEAVEEFLRMQPLVNSTRLVKEDHEIRGVRIRKGEHIMCFNSAGNFDPDEFDDPRAFRLDRASNRHFTLAGGPHRCLGSHLARRELKIALEEFLRRIPTFSLKPGADRTAYPGLIAAPRVPVVWS